MDLKSISTEELLKELENRKGIEKIALKKIAIETDGSYSYRKKFEPRRRGLEPGTILFAVTNETPDSNSRRS